VLGDTDATDATPAIDPSIAVETDGETAGGGSAGPETAPDVADTSVDWGRWMLWAVIVVAVGMLARAVMRPRAGSVQR